MLRQQPLVSGVSKADRLLPKGAVLLKRGEAAESKHRSERLCLYPLSHIPPGLRVPTVVPCRQLGIILGFPPGALWTALTVYPTLSNCSHGVCSQELNLSTCSFVAPLGWSSRFLVHLAGGLHLRPSWYFWYYHPG